MPLRTAPRVGVGRFRDSDSYFSRGTTAPDGSASMTRLVAVQIVNPVLTRNDFVANDRALVGGGFRMLWDGVTFRFTTTDGAGGGVNGSVLGGFTPQLGELHIIAGGYDGTTLRVRTDRQPEASAVVAGTPGFTAPVGDAFTVGVQPGLLGSPSTSFAILAIMGSDTTAVTGSAALQALAAGVRDDLEQGRYISTPAGLDEFYWDARDWAPGQATWTDRIGALTLTTNGDPELYGLQGVV